MFLKGNGVAVDRKHDMDVYNALIAIAEHRMTKSELAALFRKLFTAQ